jgi:hypothetical protein
MKWAIGLLAAAAAAGAEPYEGELKIEIKGRDLDNSVAAVLKGNKAKLVPSVMKGEIQGYPLLDFEAKKVRVVSLKDKFYMEMSLEMMERRLAEKTLGIKGTPAREKILGHDAEEWTAADPESGLEIRLWGTRELQSKVNFLVGMQRAGPDGLVVARAARELLMQGLFPLRLTAKKKDDPQELVWRVVELKPGRVEDATFEVPPGYQRMSQMMQKKPGGRR